VNAEKSNEGPDSSEIGELLKKLSGRVVGEIWVVDGRSSEKRLFCSYDFDYRDTVEIVFMAEEIPKEDPECDTGKAVFTFGINQMIPGEEVDTDMAAKQKGLSQKALDDFSEALTMADPTCEDYLLNVDINFEDLSLKEKCRVLEHDLENLLDMFDSYGYSEEEKKPGLFARLFSKNKTAA
jgi:hypothetical protein